MSVTKKTSQYVQVLLKDVLRSNNNIHLHNDILKLARQELRLVFSWQKVHEFVNAIAASYVKRPKETPLCRRLRSQCRNPLTAEALKKALLAFARRRSPPDPHHTTRRYPVIHASESTPFIMTSK